MQLHGHQLERYGPFTKILIKVASADEDTLRISPPHDLAHVKATAELLLLTMVYQSGVFSLVSYSLFAAAGQFRPDLILASVFIAYFIMLIDSFCVVGSQWSLNGIEEIGRGGLDISGGRGARVKSLIYLAFRILLSIGLSMLTAIFVSILVFASDIASSIESANQQANAHLLAEATGLVDAAIRRATDEVQAEQKNVTALSAQVSQLRQGEIDPLANDPGARQTQDEIVQLTGDRSKADDELHRAETFATQELAGAAGPGHSGVMGVGPKRQAALEQVTNARNHAQQIDAALAAARDQLQASLKSSLAEGDAPTAAKSDKLSSFEASLKAESDRLSVAKVQADRLTAGREDAIRSAIEKSPEYVALNEGFLARIVALEAIAHSDPKITMVIALIDVTSFGLELAAVLAKITSFQPTTYAALIARDAYLRALHIADEITREIELGRPVLDAAAIADSTTWDDNSIPFDEFDIPPDEEPEDPPPPPEPPKRPRGRPPKQPPAEG